MTKVEEKQLDLISTLLSGAGYDPYAQILGYLKTGNNIYITRNGNARQMIEQIDKEAINDYLKKN